MYIFYLKNCTRKLLCGLRGILVSKCSFARSDVAQRVCVYIVWSDVSCTLYYILRGTYRATCDTCIKYMEFRTSSSRCTKLIFDFENVILNLNNRRGSKCALANIRLRCKHFWVKSRRLETVIGDEGVSNAKGVKFLKFHPPRKEDNGITRLDDRSSLT